MKKKATRTAGKSAPKAIPSEVNKSLLIVESFNRGFSKPREIRKDIMQRTGLDISSAYIGIVKHQKCLSREKTDKNETNLTAAGLVLSLGGSFKDAMSTVKSAAELHEVALLMKCGGVDAAIEVINELKARSSKQAKS